MTIQDLRAKATELREQFSILKRQVHSKRLVYLDSAATTLKPDSVIDCEMSYYRERCANIHRGVHLLSEEATSQYEVVRAQVRKLLNAEAEEEIIFTSGTTQSINLLAQSFGETLMPGDEIILSGMEHHSNIVPWQMLAQKKQLTIRHIPVRDSGDLDYDAYEKLLNKKTRLLSVVHTSNSLGTCNDIPRLVRGARSVGAKVMLDAAQAVAHVPIDVQALDIDFLAFSGHKVFAPTGVGVLYGRRELLEQMPPVFGGGDMIDRVTFEKTTYAGLPSKFEPGTPNIAGIIGLGSALDFLDQLDWEFITGWEEHLIATAQQRLKEIDGLQLFTEPSRRSGAVPFLLGDVHPHDIGTILDRSGIAVRTGHHCTQPVMDRFSVPATTRASFSIYNSEEDIEALVQGIEKVRSFFL